MTTDTPAAPPPDITQSPDYPEVLSDLAARARAAAVRAGLAEDTARALAVEIAEEMRDAWGGQSPYIPKGHRLDVLAKWERMWADFNGANYDELARRYGVSRMQAYRAIERMRRIATKRQQGDLFPDAAGAAEG